MLDTIMGVPAHALIVHATVVLLPLAALTAIAIAVLPPLRRRYGLPVGLLALVAAILVPITTNSGERLFDRRSAQFGPGDTVEAGLMERHADLAEGLLPWTLVLLVGVALVLGVPVLTRHQTRQAALTGAGTGTRSGAGPDREQVAPATPAWAKLAAAVAVVVTLVGAGMTLVQVVRIGHAGSEAAWSRVDGG